MSEHQPIPVTPDALAAQLVQVLRITYPGIVEEWERQRADAMASGEDGWPGLQTASDARWWLESEIRQAESFIDGDATGREQAIADYCRNAAEQLRAEDCVSRQEQ